MAKPTKHPKYLAWLAQQPCVVTGRTDDIIVHHLTSLVHGNRITRNDRYAVPLVTHLHQDGPHAVHVMGVAKFEAFWDVDLTAEAERLWQKWEGER